MTDALHALYSLVLATLLLAYGPVALWRRLTRGVPLHLRERLGFYQGAPVEQPAIWVHSVSVGETLAAVPLVDALRRRYPAVPIVLTTVTATGARVAADRLGAVATHRFFPIDLPGPIRRALRANRPRCLIVLETELWPNLLRALARRRIPVMIANGRLSDRAFRRYHRVRGVMRRALAPVSVFAMRSAEDSRRIIALGADPARVFVTGDLKLDGAGDQGAPADRWRRLLAAADHVPVWIAGSTHPGEEEIVLAAHARALARHPGLVLVLAPRHPERVDAVLRLCRERGRSAVRRSELPGRGEADRPGREGSSRLGREESSRLGREESNRLGREESNRLGREESNRLGREESVVVLDTIGELADLYGVAEVVFVGGSLVPAGGHNVVEPALRRKPVLVGPHASNFRESVALLVESGGACVVEDAEDLEAALLRLLNDPPLRSTMGAAAHAAVASRQGAVRETLELIERHLLR